MDKKIKFANIFNNNTYDPDKEDDEDAYDISPADILIQDIDLKRNYNSRYRFYTELLKIYNKNPKIIKKVYTKLNAIKDLNGMEKKLLSELIYYNNKLDKTTGGSGRGNRSSSKSDRRDGGGGGDGVLEGYKESKLRDVLKKDYDMPNISKLNKNINEKNPNSDKDTGDKITDFNNQIDKYYDDIDMSVDINIIKSFEEGFFYYAVIYLAIFWFIVLFVNIDNTTKVDYMNFDNFMNSIRSVFYYFYMGTNGITRLLVHSCIICVLLIVPIILNIKKSTYIEEENNDKDKNIISYEERKKLSKSLSLFTIFIWVLTSIIATKF